MTKANILVVEDESIAGYEIATLLRKSNYQVLDVLTSGESAITVATQINPDIIIMDIGLSGDIDGIEAARIINQKRKTPVLFLFAQTDKDLLNRTKKMLPYGYLQKPFKDRELIFSIKMALYAVKLNADDANSKASENLHRLILDHTSDMIFLTDDDGKFIYVSPNVYNILGYRPDEINEFGTIDQFFGLQPILTTAVQEKKEFTTIECQLDNKQLEKRDMLVTIKKVSSVDATTLYACRDITDQKQADRLVLEKQANIEALIENTDDIIWSVDSKYQLITANRKFKDLVGIYLNRPVVPGESVFFDSIISGERITEWQSLYDKALKGEKFKAEMPLMNDTDSRSFLLYFNPIRSHYGAIIGVAILGMDITQRERDHQIILNQQRELQDTNIALRVLLEKSAEQKSEANDEFYGQVKKTILPTIEKLKAVSSDIETQIYVKHLETTINELIAPISDSLKSLQIQLTPSELQISNLIREGQSTKDIAEALHLSIQTIEFHRKNIRKKLGLANRKVNLQSYLQTL